MTKKQKYNRKYYRRNKKKIIERNRKSVRYISTKKMSNYTGEAGERFVTALLLKLGLEIYVPANRTCKHDLLVKFSTGLKTVQVKTAVIAVSTGSIILKNTVGIASDIVAVVDITTWRVRWKTGLNPVLPEELRRENGV